MICPQPGFGSCRHRLPEPLEVNAISVVRTLHARRPCGGAIPWTESTNPMPEKVALISLGCPKNLVDSEMMLGHLKTDGYELTTDAADADVIVVNTCGFLGAAAQESVDALLEAAERKKGGKCRAVIAAGCMTQRFGTEAAA